MLSNRSFNKYVCRILVSVLLMSLWGSSNNFVVECGNVLCREKPLEQNIHNADVIITGMVRKLERLYSESIYGAYVQIHRILKGFDQMNDFLRQTSATIDDSSNSREKFSNKFLAKRTNKMSLINGNVLFVKNFGSSSICESHVKPNDVRVFLLKLVSENKDERSIYLNSSLVKIEANSLRNSASNGKNDEELKDYMKCKFDYLFKIMAFIIMFIS